MDKVNTFHLYSFREIVLEKRDGWKTPVKVAKAFHDNLG